MSPPRSPSALSRSPSVLSRSSSVSSRRLSVSSTRTPTRGTFFVCRHELTTSRLNALLSQLSLDLNTIKTKKCFECQTSTAAATLKLIAAMTTAPNVDKLDPYMVKQASQLLFERVAGQRRKTDNGFKDDWSNIELAFATFCYHHIAPTQLSDLCHTVRTRFGAGVDRQLLKALVKAACRENGVWENIIDPTEPIVYVTLNTYIEKLRAETELIERFKDVQYMFKNAEDLGKLAIETVAVLREIDARLSR